MNPPPINLFVADEPVTKLSLSKKQQKPNVRVVYATADGVLEELGRPMSVGESLWARYKHRYDIDASDHEAELQITGTQLPSSEAAYYFVARVRVGFRVYDGIEVVRRNIRDAVRVVQTRIEKLIRPTCQRFDIERVAEAETAVNDQFRNPVRLQEGIELYLCDVQLSLDRQATTYLRGKREAQRQAELKDMLRREKLNEAHHDNDVAVVQSEGELDRLRRKVAEIAAMNLDEGRLIQLYIAQNPDNAAQAINLLQQKQQAQQAREDERLQTQVNLFEFLVKNNIIRGPHLNQALGSLVGSVLSSSPQPHALPPPPPASPAAWALPASPWSNTPLPGTPLPNGALPGAPPVQSAPPAQSAAQAQTAAQRPSVPVPPRTPVPPVPLQAQPATPLPAAGSQGRGSIPLQPPPQPPPAQVPAQASAQPPVRPPQRPAGTPLTRPPVTRAPAAPSTLRLPQSPMAAPAPPAAAPPQHVQPQQMQPQQAQTQQAQAQHVPAQQTPAATVPAPVQEGPWIQPVYFALDESFSAAPWSQAIDNGLQQFLSQVGADPACTSIRVTVLGFGDQVSVKLPMAQVTVGAVTAPVVPAGTANYAAVFADLLLRVPDDVARLKQQGYRLNRPVIFLLSASEPADPTTWPALHAQLVSREVLRAAPNIVACGIGTARPQSIRAVATRREFGFVVGTEHDVDSAVAAFWESVTASVLFSGRALAQDKPALSIQQPRGFVLAPDEV
jgi:uncharacterized protein YegL